MVQLAREDIRTDEVLEWNRVHLFHMTMSSCSQKVRAALNIKNVGWVSHLLDPFEKENLSTYYLGINPRGLVPTLIDDGAVHIESNDILLHLEARFPDHPLIPVGKETELRARLEFEDELHLDLRRLSFRFLFSPGPPPKSAADLERYATAGSGTVHGEADPGLARELAFWTAYNANGGVTDAEARAAAQRFLHAFGELEEKLGDHAFLMGDALSYLDLAWIIYVNRLALAGYPIEARHPRLWRWFEVQRGRSEIASEIAIPAAMAEALSKQRAKEKVSGESFEAICLA